ncbi:MAG: S49 family peptidase [Candidatus Accumulibacter meliphilus]|uniref:S49 family peptidase n=1 Tax=Candidatus Accumulibacter meliphilus TaxID=2211374 RepID=UPI002FC3CD9F
MLQEQRVKRRWGIFFKLIGFSYLLAVLLLFVDWGGGSEKLVNGKHTALVHINGTIASGGEGSAESINEALRSAFDDKETAGIVLRVNSPGGSPVQAGIVHDEIRRLRSKHPQISLYVVVEDLCASGGYYVAVAADKIFVDKASIVGSIGVLMDGFGFTGTMDKLGVERRLLTAGVNKGFLDPFSPQDAEQKKHAQVLLGEIHRQFIEVVRKGRGERLKETPEMFSGLMWTGMQSIRLGLADDLGTVESVAREVIKAERIVDFTIKENIAERFAKRLRADAAQSAGSLLGAIDWPALR